MVDTLIGDIRGDYYENNILRLIPDRSEISCENDSYGLVNKFNIFFKEKGLNIDKDIFNNERFIKFIDNVDYFILSNLSADELSQEEFTVLEDLGKRSLKAKIDFERRSKRPPKQLLMDDLTSLISPEIAQTLGKHYSLINAILGLEDFEGVDIYQFVLTDLGVATDGDHMDNIRFEQAMIRLNKRNYLKACINSNLNYLYSQLPDRYDSTLVEMIETIAHELYHKRQALIFPQFYSRHGVDNYITAWEDYEGYHNQLIEVGARAFARKYIEYLNDHPELLETEELRLAISNYVNGNQNYYRILQEMLVKGKFNPVSLENPHIDLDLIKAEKLKEL